jgi:hypothetical protein
MRPIKHRFWLSFTPLVQFQPLPLVDEFTRKFGLGFSIRNSAYSGDLGIIGIELEGQENAIGASVEWLESAGVAVEPIELSVIEG